MKVIHDFEDFCKLVEPLYCDDFDGLDIKPSTPSGIFGYDRYLDLMEFCKKNPEYHVISHLGSGVAVNKPLEKVTSYELGKGEKNPELTYIAKISWKSYEGLKILKFNVDKL